MHIHIGGHSKPPEHYVRQRHALLYPIFLDDVSGNFYILHATTLLDCLDRDASTFDRSGCGVRKWVFKEESVGDADFFWLTAPYQHRPFVSERFKKRVHAARLKGFRFKKEFLDFKPWVS